MRRPPTSLMNDVRQALRNASLGANDLLIIGLSGGVDSQTLTRCLATARDAHSGPKLLAVHVDHQLRPGSTRDAAECRQVAERLGVPIEVIAVDVPAWDRGLGVEAAARDARFAALASVAAQHGTPWVALGHTLDDQVETVLLRLARGTSLDGLTAMRRVSRLAIRLTPDGQATTPLSLLRPLLTRSRTDIEEYARVHRLVPIEDETNDDPRFRRNSIRRQLLPLLEQISPGARRSIVRSINLMAADAYYLNEVATKAFSSCVTRIGPCLAIKRSLFSDLPRPIQGRVVVIAMHDLSPGIDLTSERVDAVSRAIASGAASKRIQVGEGIDALIDYERAVLGPADRIEPTLLEASGVPLLAPDIEHHIAGSTHVDLSNGWMLDIACSEDQTEWVLRTRRDGDRIQLRDGQARKLQDWIVNHKVPAYLRDRLALLVSDGIVRWVAGFSSPTFEDVDSGLTARLVRSAKDDRPDDERVAGHPSA